MFLIQLTVMYLGSVYLSRLNFQQSIWYLGKAECGYSP